MKISFYLHAWQGILMFLAGILCVLASFFGYLKSGGGEELLRRALLNVSSGKATYQSPIEFNWRSGRIEVSNIRHEDFSWPKDNPVATLKNLLAPRLIVQLEGWPASVASITIEGLRGAVINVNEGFLQGGKVPDAKPPVQLPRLKFVDCDLEVSVGHGAALKLKNCSGELFRDANGNLRGGFSLRELNGQPFELTIEALENGRWAVTGGRIQLDTKAALEAANNPFAAKVDPVSVLIQALFSGELGAKGTINSLHINVQPKTERMEFACEGDLSYSKLSFKLPPAEKRSGKVLPFFMDLLLGADEKEQQNLWPTWMQVDEIVTGDKGRIAFHMAEGRLDFSCDEGPTGAITGTRQFLKPDGKTETLEFPLESLKGSVERGPTGAPRRILLRGFFGDQRGFFGDQLSFETRIERSDDNTRTYELWFEPRPGDSTRYKFNRPLWRFNSRATDYFSVRNRASDLPLAEFEIEANSHTFPRPDWLPPGITELAGRFFAKGGLYNLDGAEKDLLLRFNDVRLDDGAKIVFNAPKSPRVPGEDFHPFWEAFYALFATQTPWRTQDLNTNGEVAVRFSREGQLQLVELKQWRFTSGMLIRDDQLTSFALPELRLDGIYKQAATPTEEKSAEFKLKGSDWSAELRGDWVHTRGKTPGGNFELRELSVPLKLHPLRESLKQNPNTVTGVSRVSKVTVTSQGAKVETIGP